MNKRAVRAPRGYLKRRRYLVGANKKQRITAAVQAFYDINDEFYVGFLLSRLRNCSDAGIGLMTS